MIYKFASQIQEFVVHICTLVSNETTERLVPELVLVFMELKRN